MLRGTFVFLVIALAAWASGASDVVVGKWSVTATDANGADSQWTLAVKEEAGRLSGVLSNAEGASFHIQEPVLKGAVFSFKVTIGEGVFNVETKIDGKKFTGKFTSAEMSGTLKGAKE